MTEDTNPLFDADTLAALRRDMLRFAELQLRNRAQAEDAVQDALAAAFANHERFASRSSLRTWVLSILKNKIVDVFRQRARGAETVLYEEATSSDEVAAYFDERGHWSEETQPADWGDPEQAFASRQFWRVFETCLYRLPDGPSRVFLMRELVGAETAEICAELRITPNNCAVLLHRARLGLRACLGENWFATEVPR